MREGGFVRHQKINVCLDSKDQIERGGIAAERCNSALDSQRWEFVTKYTWEQEAIGGSRPCRRGCNYEKNQEAKAIGRNGGNGLPTNAAAAVAVTAKWMPNTAFVAN